MPELPEVETVCRDLRPLIVGRTLVRVLAGKQKLREPWQPAWSKKLAGTQLKAIHRRGKWILVEQVNDAWLLLHLGMTGQLTVHEHREPIANHTHLQFRFENEQELRFRDVRRFGSASYFPRRAELQQYLDDRLGPEPFGINATYFQAQARSSKRPLKAFLLDQTVLAGIGNIYADESCFVAKLHPGRHAASLSEAECNALRIAIESVLTKAVAGRGSTIRDYIGGSGLKGSYQDEFAVYGRTGKPCVECRTAIAMQRIGGRSSHFCPRCQKESR